MLSGLQIDIWNEVSTQKAMIDFVLADINEIA
jgi:hypothetical protein